MARKIVNMTIPQGPVKEPESYFHVLIDILKRPANGQATNHAEMTATVPVIIKLEDHKNAGSAIFEEAEYELICARLKAPMAGFTSNSVQAFQMLESIINSEKFDLQDVSKG